MCIEQVLQPIVLVSTFIQIINRFSWLNQIQKKHRGKEFPYLRLSFWSFSISESKIWSIKYAMSRWDPRKIFLSLYDEVLCSSSFIQWRSSCSAKICNWSHKLLSWTELAKESHQHKSGHQYKAAWNGKQCE